MFSWWAWLVIWGCLVLALLAVLVISAWRLFRKAVGVLDELEVLGTKFGILDREAELVEEQREQLAILAGARATRERRERVREAALQRKADRHERRLARAKEITSVDASTREWFPTR